MKLQLSSISSNYELFSLPPYKRNLTTGILQSSVRKQKWKILVPLHMSLIFLTNYTTVSRPLSEHLALTCNFPGMMLTCGQLFLFFSLYCYISKTLPFIFYSQHPLLRKIQVTEFFPTKCLAHNVAICCTLLLGSADIVYSSRLQSPLEAESRCRTVLRWTTVISYLDWLQACSLPPDSYGL